MRPRDRDNMLVQASINGGDSYTTLRKWSSRNPNQLQWSDNAIDLSSYDGRLIRVRFRFDSMNDRANNFGGWMLDDVEITGS